MPLNPLPHNQRGAALMIVLVIMVIMGLVAGITGSTWKTIVQRAKEEELLWRGEQYRRAIESYMNLTRLAGGQTSNPRQVQWGPPPKKLDELIRDPRYPGVRRHIRRLYKDPLTGEDWVLVKDGGGYIKGVRSSSAQEPFKKGNFPSDYENFEQAKAYSDWQFVFEPGRVQSQASGQPRKIRGLPEGSTPTWPD